MHILLVEDDDRITAALRPALHRHGMTTSRLATGRGAVDQLGGACDGDAGSADATSGVVVVDGISVDLHRHIVTVGDRPVTLTRKEFRVLALLASSGDAVCTRNRIVAEVWGAAGPARTGRWTSTWPPCGRSSAVLTSCRPCAGWAIAWGSRRASLPKVGSRACRMLVIVLFLVGLLAVGPGVPLALSSARVARLELFTDTIRYASLAEGASPRPT